MIVFILNMVSISMVMMAAVVLIILRERTDTQLLMAAICLEAMVALGALLWVDPGTMDNHYLAIRTIGRVIEGIIMWYVIVMQVRGIQRTLLTPTATEVVNQEISELKAQIVALKEQEAQHDVVIEQIKSHTGSLRGFDSNRTLGDN